MNRNNLLKSSKVKKAPTFNPATNPATLNVVTFSFRLQNPSQPQEVLKNEEDGTNKEKEIELN